MTSVTGYSGASGTSSAPVLLLHGLFMGPWAMQPLARRLAGGGLRPRCLGYPTVRGTLAANIALVATALQASHAVPAHVVCHSMGGLLLRHVLHAHPEVPLGRTVMLGTPNGGSHVARSLARLPALRALFACGMAHGLDGSAPPWPPGREVGVVAGIRPLGAGRLVPGLALPNDGTVALAETRLPGAPPPLALPVTHTGMLFSLQVTHHTLAFLNEGRFPAGPAILAKTRK